MSAWKAIVVELDNPKHGNRDIVASLKNGVRPQLADHCIRPVHVTADERKFCLAHALPE